MCAKRGYTLLEVLIAFAIMTVVAGMVFSLMFGMDKTADLQNAKIIVDDDVRMAASLVMRDVRQATAGSLVIASDANDVLQYQIPVDSDGNGVSLDMQFKLELSPVRTLMRDTEDLNGDGLTKSQLILVEDKNITVLANNLLLNEDENGDGELSDGEDLNNNGVLDHGLLFERLPEGIHVVIQSNQKVSQHGVVAVSSIEQTIIPRN